MTSDEISKATFDHDILRPKRTADNFKALMLQEIAFQLAKLNEHFEMVDQSVFGGKNAKEEK